MNRPRIRTSRSPNRPRRGVIFITALGIILILSGLLLAFAQQMRTEALSSANRLSQLQADAVEQAAEQWVEAQIDLNYNTDANGNPDSWTLCYQTPAEAIQVGNGYFWLLRPDEDTDQQFDFGITDECSKINLNMAASGSTTISTVLQQLPTDMTSDVADAVMDWCNGANKASSDGAESDYYNGLQVPYNCKNLPYESVEEMLLVRGITPETLFGMDLNRNGVVDDAERNAAQTSGTYNSSNDTRGIFRYLTVYSVGEPALTTSTGGKSTHGTNGATATATATSSIGRINVNTASENVFMALGLTQQEADGIIQQRSSGAITDSTTLQQAMSSPLPSALSNLITTTSFHYSADIVAVSADGRAFKRVRIVVSCAAAAAGASTTGGTSTSTASATATPTAPCQIIYRRDLTASGWPLDPQIRTQLRNGQTIQPGTTGGTPMAGINVKPGVL
jgi:type II secretory pathway component PulK